MKELNEEKKKEEILANERITMEKDKEESLKEIEALKKMVREKEK